MNADAEYASLGEVLDEVASSVEEDSTTVGELLDSFSSKAHGPLLLLPGLISISPIGAIPGMSIAMGALILLVSIQMLLSTDHPWIPDRLERLGVDAGRVEKAIGFGRRIAKRIDPFLEPRASWVVRGPGLFAIAVTTALLGCSMWPLALVPFGVAVPGIAVSLYGLAITVGDGHWAIAGHVVSVAAFGLLVYAVSAL